MSHRDIYYSEKYYDDVFEYRSHDCVFLINFLCPFTFDMTAVALLRIGPSIEEIS